jgi:aminoglycoside phosphotransferase (APT) family kinase protein
MDSAQPDPMAIASGLGLELTADPAPVKGGQDAAIWKIEEEGEQYALRVFPGGRERGFAREVSAMRGAAAAGLPVPRLRAAGAVDGHLAMAIAWCEGRPMLSAVSNKPWLLWHHARLLGKQQALLQQIPAPDELREDAPGYWLARSGPGEPIAEVLTRRGVRSDALVHMDFHPLNVMVNGDGSISGIIDWTGAAAGDPRADLALTASILSVAPAPPGHLRRVLLRARRLLYGAWRGAYEEVAGKQKDEEIAPFFAWAGTVMLREMEPRAREGRSWPTMDDLEPIRKWKQDWIRRAGLA